MPLTQVQSGLLESGAALNNIGAGTITPSYLNTQAQYTGFKNRIINGDMTISQRNGTSSVNANSSTAPYTTDRFNVNVGGSSAVIACQQVSDAPAGFVNSLRLTVSTAATPSSSQFLFLRQIIEGFNIADFAWGTANAATVTLSFWVKASIAGTYSAFAINSAEDRSYVATFTVSATNTWEYKTITIPGDTTGTWLTNNSNGIRLGFDLGSGSNFNGTANAWQSGWEQRTSGTVNWVGTSGATFQVTGVQLEKGSVATSFDYLPYGTELALCQRYFCKSFPQTVVPANNVAVDQAINGIGGRIQVADVLGFRGQQYFFPVTMRTTPSITMFNPLGASGTGSYFTENASTQNPASPGPYVTSEYNFGVWQYTGVTVGSTGTLVMVIFHYTASAEL